jgi:cysteine-rich repeat protein
MKPDSTLLSLLSLSLLGCSFDAAPEGTTDNDASSGSTTSSTTMVSASSGGTTLEPTTGAGSGTVMPSGDSVTSMNITTTTDTASTGAPTGETTTGEESTASGPLCGDGVVDGDEECDDTNNDDLDGCSSICQKEYRMAFVTAARMQGGQVDISSANLTCQTEAMESGLPGTYLAWFGSGAMGPAQTFIHSSVPYVRVDKMQVAADWNALVSGMLELPISLDASGNPPGVGTHSCDPANTSIAWTNVTQTGMVSTPPNMQGWE